MFAYFDEVFTDEIRTPIDATEIAPLTQPSIYNATNQNGTLFGDVIAPANVTDSTPWDFLTDNLFFGLQQIQTLVGLMSGQFVWEFLTILGLPEQFVLILQGVIGIFFAITVIHFWTGRF
jgi:hypothetical protein